MGLIGEASKKAHLLCRSTGSDDLGRSQHSIFKPITAAGLTQDNPFGELIAWLMCDCLMQVRIERFPFGLDCLQPVFSEQVVKLFLNENHSGIYRRTFALLLCGCEAELEIINNSDQPLE